MTFSRLQKLAMQDPYQFPENWVVPGQKVRGRDRKMNELHLWRQWKESNEDPQYLEPLMRSLKPTIEYRVNKFAPANVYKPALRAKAHNLTIQALRKFDPTRSQINTHVTTNLKSLNRWTGQHQNVSRITEERIAIIGKYKSSRDRLTEELGAAPTPRQIADDLGVPERTIKKLELEDRPDLIASTFEGDAFADDLEAATLDKEIMDLIEFDLSPDELRLWNYLYGLNGYPQVVKGGALARKLGWSQSKVSQTRKKVYKKIEYYRQGLL